MFKMLKDFPGSPNGYEVKEYLEGQVYPQPGFPETDDLLDAFLAAGAAVECDEAGESLPVDETEQVDQDGDPTTPPVTVPKPRSKKR